MKPEAAAVWAVPVALVLGLIWAVTRLEYHKFEDKNLHCKPQVQEGTTRFGWDGAWLQPEEVGPLDLVRFRTARSAVDHTARVIAVQGQRVKIEAGVVFVDGAKADDPYAYSSNEADWFPEMVVPAGCVFVLADQRWRGNPEKLDSRGLGPIPVRAVSERFAPRDKVDSGKRR